MKLRTIFWFWVPLAFSWLLMTFEGPWIQAVISRKADPELQLAAFGLVMSLSVTIEAPVIMFLAVGSALARHKQAYRLLWRYTMAINVFVTIVAALMAFTPLLDLYLGGLLGIPQPIIDATRPGMVIMIFWSGFIGYRRFHQGILIRNDRTRSISIGTVIRIVVSAGIAFGLGVASDLPGAVIGAWSLIAAVLTEMIYVHIIMRPDIEQLEKIKPDDVANLTYRRVMRFHLPLALTSLLTLLVRPVIESGLASAPNAEQALAAFPIIFSLALLMRSGGLAWQEVVISLHEREGAPQALSRFTWLLGLSLTGLMALLAFTPLIQGYLGVVLNVPASLHELIILGTGLAVLIPLFTTLQSYLRARLMLMDTTSPIYQGMLLSFGCTALIVFAGVALALPGIAVASIALTGGLALELLFLWWAFTRNVKDAIPSGATLSVGD